MVINFLGDSITEGSGADPYLENRYSTVLCKMLGAKENNYGIGGTRIARQTNPSKNPREDMDFVLRAPTMDKKADYVYIFGGTNDFGHGDAPIGKFGDDTVFTFYGALKILIEYLIDTYGKEKLCFILPLPRVNQDSIYGEDPVRKGGPSHPLSVYKAIEKEMFDYYGLYYLDISDLFPVPTSYDGDELTVDGLHPNNKGHKLIAERLYAELKKLGV